MDKTESKIKDTSTFDSSIDEFLWKPSKNDLYKYKHVLQSSDDDQSKNSNSNVSFIFKIFFLIIYINVYFILFCNLN